MNLRDEKKVPVSIDLLYEGMIVPHDIHNADDEIILLRSGLALRSYHIEALRNSAKGSNSIYVSRETRRMLLENSLACKINERAVLEEEVGYAEAKDEAETVFKEIEETRAVTQEKIGTVSENLTNKVEITMPDKLLDLINALAPVDEYLKRHCINVSLLNGLIGKWLELPAEKVELLVLVGLVHDCGKAAIPEQVLNAPRRLAIAEFEIIKMHPVYGKGFLSEFPEEVRYGVYGHHEKLNGQGYPDGVSGEDITFAARVSAVSDIYDAMVSQRVYKKPLDPFRIISWINNMAAGDLDPLIVNTFVNNMPRELIGKPVMLSSGDIGAVHAIDFDDLEHPYIRTGNRIIKSSHDLHCVHMYFEDEPEYTVESEHSRGSWGDSEEMAAVHMSMRG